MSSVRRSSRQKAQAPKNSTAATAPTDTVTDTRSSWDDWVPQDRLRKFSEENKELAHNLKKQMEQSRKESTKTSTSTAIRKSRQFGSELTGSSARGSEERASAAPLRGTKRGRDGRELDGIEKVSSELSRPLVI